MSACGVQLSVALGNTQLTTAPQVPFPVITVSFGQEVKTGGTWSMTTAVKKHVAVLPDLSRAVYVIWVWPGLKAVPDCIVENKVSNRQLSVANGFVQVNTVSHLLRGNCTTILEGQVPNAGGVASPTVTVKEQVAVLPDSSRAVYVIWV